MKTFTVRNWKKSVEQADRPVLVDFFATWCQPCREFTPVVEQVAEALGERVLVGKLDIDTDEPVAERYSVISVPTIGLFVGGKVKSMKIGSMSLKSILAWVEREIG